MLDDFSSDNVFFDYLVARFGFEENVERVLGVYADERSLRAHTETTDGADTDLVFEFFLFDELFKSFSYSVSARRYASGTAAEHEPAFAVRAVELALKRNLVLGYSLFEFFEILYHFAASLVLYSLMMPGTSLTETCG